MSDDTGSERGSTVPERAQRDETVSERAERDETVSERAQRDEELHGKIRLIEENCTSCMICARECPVWCIQIDSHTEVDSDAPAQLTGRGMRERTKNVLDRFEIDWSLCMYCGICVEECPFDALEWNGAHVRPADSLATLVHGVDELG